MENGLRILTNKFVVPSNAGDGQIQGSGSDSLLRTGVAPASSLHREASISWVRISNFEGGSELELPSSHLSNNGLS